MYKYYKNKLSGSKYIWNLIKSIFPDKEFLTKNKKKGNYSVFKLKTWHQLILLPIFLFLIFWITYTSYVFFNYNKILEDKNKNFEKVQKAYEKASAEISLYTKNIQEINQKLEKNYDYIVDLLTKNEGNISPEEENKIIKSRLFLSAELNYINDKILSLYNNDILETTGNEEYYDLKDLEFQRNVAWQEREKLRKRNEELEIGMKNLKKSQKMLLDKVDATAEEEISEIEEILSKIQKTLKRLGIKDSDKLIKKYDKENQSLGGPFIPLENTELSSFKIDENLLAIDNKVTKWYKLKQIKEMLPLGNPLQQTRITSLFGMRKDPFTGSPTLHTGIDFRGEIGTPLYTVAPGKVIQAGKRGAYGLAVQIDHGLGFTSLYAHLSKVKVKKGDVIDTKKIIGLGGNTGRSTGPHLHYELRYNNNPINPLNFIKAKKISYDK